MATYPPALCRWLAEGIAETLADMAKTGSGPTGHQRSSTRCPRISCFSEKLDKGAFHFLNEASSRERGVVLGESDTSFYLHIDDGLIAAAENAKGSGKAKVNALVHQVADALEDVGFVVKDRREHGLIDRIVGYEIETSPARVRVPRRKAALLYEALKAMTEREWVHLDHLASVMGVWIWAALLARHWLSAPQHLFQFTRQEGPRWRRWWPSARREAVAMQRGVMGLYADLGAPLLPLVFASDAEGAQDFDAGGFGVVAAAASVSQVEEFWRAGTRPGAAMAKPGQLQKVLDRGPATLEPHLPVSAIARGWIDSEAKWVPVESGRWQRADHIVLGEGRAALRVLARLAVIPEAHRSKVLSLEDNLAFAGAAAKGRSTAGPVNYLLRRRCALSSASEIRMHLPWIETERMPADGLSRSRGCGHESEGPRAPKTNQVPELLARRVRAVQN